MAEAVSLDVVNSASELFTALSRGSFPAAAVFTTEPHIGARDLDAYKITFEGGPCHKM